MSGCANTSPTNRTTAASLSSRSRCYALALPGGIMKSVAIAVAAACALPLAAAAQMSAMPRIFQGMEKGQWKVDVLEHSQAKGQRMPSMTMCTESLMKQAKEHPADKS